jgi:hypothetical protein
MSAQGYEIVHEALALLGLLFSIWNAVESWFDVRALEHAGIDHGASYAARDHLENEAVRALQFVLLLALGAIAMAHAPTPVSPYSVGLFVALDLLMTGNAARARVRRLQILSRLEVRRR